MMQLARRAALAVVLLLLASVGTASAECAWVLWTYNWSTTSVRVGWVLNQAYPSRAECMTGITRMKERDKESEAANPGLERRYSGDDGWLRDPKTKFADGWSYRCLPDTIDPRGPNGGAR
jgi:hypothetical protein